MHLELWHICCRW